MAKAPRKSKLAVPPDMTPALTIPVEKACYLIIKARELDVKDVASDLEAGSNATDDQMLSVLEESPDDPVQDELAAFVAALTEDEQIDLVALTWLGRDDNTIDDWSTLRAEAARAHARHADHTANYLLGEPLLADYLEEGLSLLGLSCEDVAINRL